jgi:diguanylate cyclase (GGDEF)-like protein
MHQRPTEIGQHSFIYTLVIEHEDLGCWQLYCQQRLKQTDLAIIENLLCYFIYPLRNALKYQEALRFSNTDNLTQTGNRSALINTMKREMDIAQQLSKPLSLIFIDIDHFKSINDQYGHHIGDEILGIVAQQITEMVRASDRVFRYGGEEFIVVLDNTSLEGAQHLAERIRSVVENASLKLEEQFIRVTLSLGVAMLLQNESYTDLIKRADEAMFQAKRNGRNKVEIAKI